MDARVKRVIEIIEECYREKLSEPILSKNVNLSTARLRQLFKEELGLSPMQYIKRVRMNRASKLLRTSFHSIKEIAFLSGANDLSHFVRDFKKEYGVTPSVFRLRGHVTSDARMVKRNRHGQVGTLR